MSVIRSVKRSDGKERKEEKIFLKKYAGRHMCVYTNPKMILKTPPPLHLPDLHPLSLKRKQN